MGARNADAVEREVKLGVWPGFRLPDLDGVIEGVIASPVAELRLEATYYDTPDARLARSGVSVRFRSGDGSGWTLKLPDDQPGSDAIVRREMTFDGKSGTVPSEIAALVVSFVRTSSLGPIARLRTVRRSVRLVDVEGSALGEVVDDEVSVLEGRRVAARFREVEAEVGEQAPAELLDALVSRLRAAGAGAPDPTPKVKRALGPVAQGPPELEPVELGSKPTAADVVRAALTASVARMLRHDPGVRLGDDPEDVHQMRVATRRLRSDLKTYGSLVDEEWATRLRDELREVASDLGEVRDADVLVARLGTRIDELAPEDAAQGGELLTGLEEERAEARDRLLRALEDDRYAALLDRLVEGARAPHVTPEAGAPAVEALPPLVRRPWRHLRDTVASLGPDPADEEVHGVRIRAKRCRYAAEVAALVVGKPAQRFADAVADLQEVLGDFQDAVVAESWLRKRAADAGPEAALVAGQLIATERAVAADRRREWPKAWRAASRGKLRAWLT